MALGLAVVAVLASSLPSPASQNRPVTSRQQRPPEMQLIAQTPWVAPNGDFLAEFAVTGAPTGAQVRYRLYDKVQGRARFRATLLASSLGRLVKSSFAPIPLDDLAVQPDGTRRVPIRISLRDGTDPSSGSGLLIRNGGVFPLVVDIDDRAGRTLRTVVTHVVRYPSTLTDPPLQVALVLEPHAQPGLQPDGSYALDGRDRRGLEALTDALSGQQALPLTLTPVPETLDTLAAGVPDGASLLEALQQNLPDREVLTGPYVRLVQASWVDSDMLDELSRQRIRGARVIEDQLERPETRTAVLSALTTRSATALRAFGIDRVAVPSPALDANTTIEHPFLLEGAGDTRLRAVEIDPDLSAAFSRSSDPVLGAHQLLAELATAYYDDPGATRGLVLVPPVDWQPDVAELNPLLEGLASGGTILRATTLDGLFDDVPTARTAGRAVSRSLSSNKAPPLGQLPDQLAEARAAVDAFIRFIGPDSRRYEPLDDLLLVAGSADLTPRRRQSYFDAVNRAIDQSYAGVEAPSGTQTITLSGSVGTIPLTLRNNLDYPVRVSIRLAGSKRLEFPDGNRVSPDPVLPPGTSRLSLQVRARASGDSPLTVTVLDPTGQRVLATSGYTIRSTAVSGIGLFLTVGAAFFLLLWWLRHIRLVRRERRLLAAEAAARDHADAET